MTKVFVQEDQVNSGKVTIIGSDAKHLNLVLRKEVGDQLLIGVSQTTYQGVIEQLDQNRVIVQLGEPLDTKTESPLVTRLYQGIPKGDKFELVIQKAVELGVTEIIPVFTGYTVVKLDQQKQLKKVERWQKIADEAGKQCKRDLIPKVRLPMTYSDMITELSSNEPDRISIMAYENEREVGLKQLASMDFKQVDLIIGPEGGFSETEVELFKSIEYGRIITLGTRILRTETAAISMLALVQYLWGDIG